ncbi:unnamed protein product, partial [Ceratitis capitata]
PLILRELSGNHFIKITVETSDHVDVGFLATTFDELFVLSILDNPFRLYTYFVGNVQLTVP